MQVAEDLQSAVSSADCIVLCVGDAWLAQAAQDLARELGPGAKPICLHTSGSRGPQLLAPLAKRGCPVGSFHPLAAFTPHGQGPELHGAWCAVSGDELARTAATQLASVLGARTFALVATETAALRYHTAATLLANGTVALASLAMEQAEQACIDPQEARAAFLTLLAGTLANLQQKTPERALTGPVSRGDVDTVRAHLHELAGDPLTLEVYRSLSKRMFELARRDGRLGDDEARAMERLLAQ